MVILDVAIVNVALPSIKSDLNLSQTNLQWVISAYAIMFGGVLLLGGLLADLLGRRRLFVAGLRLFAGSSLLCGLSWSESSLFAFRAVQGLGGSLLWPDRPPPPRPSSLPRRDRAAPAVALASVADLPVAHAHAGQLGDGDRGWRGVLGVLPPDALPAERAALLRDRERRCVRRLCRCRCGRLE